LKACNGFGIKHKSRFALTCQWLFELIWFQNPVGLVYEALFHQERQ